MDNNSGGLIFDILTQILGDPRTHYSSKGQASWNCPVCDDGGGKSNFEVNYFKDVYLCWACGETEDTHGSIFKLIKTWGNKDQLRNYILLRPDVIKNKPKNEDDPKVFTGLPEGFIKFSEGNPKDFQFKQAYNYIKGRGMTDDILEKYHIGYTTIGKYRNRIVIPSRNLDGNYDYFSARTYINSKPKYMNPDYNKELVVFNEFYVDWNKDVYLLEGALDHIVVENSIPWLGKKLSDLLWNTIYDNAKADVVIAYDPDATKNADRLYIQLDGGKLKGRVKVLKYNSEHDLCELHKRLTKPDFDTLLKTATRIKESKI